MLLRRGMSNTCKILSTRRPIIFIMGATGTGKSSLGLKLACELNGEIISADSMQVYQGLDILTNKVSKEDRMLCNHHCMDYIHPTEYSTVVSFRDKTLPIIEDIMKRQKLPIVVGGTNYYIEALLWDYLIKEENISADETNANDYQNKPLSDDTEKKSANSYEELKLLDPERAAMLHPNDTRKILRSLEIIKRNQVKHSSYIERQRQQPGGSFYSGPLRFSSAAIFLLECDQNVLDQKLDARCDEMIEKGLLRELYTFYQDWQVHSGSRPVNTEIGLFQSIGFKQFMPYLQLIEKEECSLDTKDHNNPHRKVLDECILMFKQATKRYSKIQRKWIENRFYRRPSDNVPAIYSFDVTPNSLKSEILERSVSISKALIEGKTPTESPVRKYTGYSEISNRLQRFTCDLCNVTVIGEKSWIAHKGSRRHRYSLRKIRRDSKSS